MKLYLSLVIIVVCLTASFSQIVTVDPPFPTVDDEITIYYDATQGSAGLVDVDQVYIHTGIITASGGPGNWMYVQGVWGTDDSNVKMTNEGNNIHSLTFTVSSYYDFPGTVMDVTELGMVFRNVDGSKEGKTANFTDIFTPIYSANSGLLGKFVSPGKSNFIHDPSENLEISMAFSKEVDVTLFDNDQLIHSESGKSIEYSYSDISPGTHTIEYYATDGNEEINETFDFIVNKDVIEADDPDNLEYGLTRLSNSSIRLKLYAPQKSFSYVLGDFNAWTLSEDGFMNRSVDGSYYWIDIENLNPTGSFSYQYYVDGETIVADPYSTLVLDENNDQGISEDVFPNLPDFPSKANGRVSHFRMSPEVFNWTDSDFDRPDQKRLNVYEVLMRDYLDDHSFQSLRDSLTYLKEMGINAIELMPVSEFENNDSWGYNPSFHMALDKYYGTPEAFKNLVNLAHELGISVILDVVYNHAFSQHPYVQLYWENNKPSASSPFFNVDAKHPFNVGYDFNHESEATKDYVKQTLKYWIEEYHIDGFRFDLSKGFTQKFSSDNGPFSAFDQSRVTILTDYANYIWTQNPETYVILEHFADNSEEKVLSNAGMMLWTNGNHNFNEGTMGYNTGGKSNFTHLSYKSKTWNDPHAVGYMESHDEERKQYKNLLYGNTEGSYSAKDPETAYDRNGMAAAFFFSIPGPKMIWQFGELGYDYSINTCTDGTINEDCRLSRKPIKWEYLQEPGRYELRKVYTAMMDLRENYDVMHTTDFTMSVSGATKKINLSSTEENVFLLGNFDVKTNSVSQNFQHDGWWFDYFTGDSILVDDNLTTIELDAGEYRMYWDKKLSTPDLTNITSEFELDFELFPNPNMDSKLTINSDISSYEIVIYNINGAVVENISSLSNQSVLDLTLSKGIYFVQMKSGTSSGVKKLVVQ